jgi:hypothetical protein
VVVALAGVALIGIRPYLGSSPTAEDSDTVATAVTRHGADLPDIDDDAAPVPVP